MKENTFINEFFCSPEKSRKDCPDFWWRNMTWNWNFAIFEKFLDNFDRSEVVKTDDFHLMHRYYVISCPINAKNLKWCLTFFVVFCQKQILVMLKYQVLSWLVLSDKRLPMIALEIKLVLRSGFVAGSRVVTESN